MEEDIQNYSPTVMFRWTPCKFLKPFSYELRYLFTIFSIILIKQVLRVHKDVTVKYVNNPLSPLSLVLFYLIVYNLVCSVIFSYTFYNFFIIDHSFLCVLYFHILFILVLVYTKYVSNVQIVQCV